MGSFAASANTSFLLGSNTPVPSGTANGVLYLNASKVVSSGSSLTFNGTELSVGGPVRTGSDGSNVGLYLGASSIRQAATGGLFIDANSTGAAGGIFFRDGSSFTTRMQIDASGNLGLGLTPSPWTQYTAIQLPGGSAYSIANYEIGLVGNAYGSSYTNWVYTTSNRATRYELGFGTHSWFIAPSGITGNPVSFTQAMTLDASGNWVVGSTNPDPFGRNDERRAAIVGGGSTDNAALSISAGASAGRGAQIYLGQTSTRPSRSAPTPRNQRWARYQTHP